MYDFGYDKLNLFVPKDSYVQKPEGLLKMKYQTNGGWFNEEKSESIKYYVNGIINTTILADGNLVLNCNPSRLQEPTEFRNKNTFLTTELEPFAKCIEKELEKVHIYVDNVLNLKICRLDVASQGIASFPMVKYKGAMDLIGGKNFKHAWNFGSSRLMKNNSFQSTIYDKSKEQRDKGYPIKDINLFRCEQRAINTGSVNRYFGDTIESLLNLPIIDLKKKYNNLLNNKVFYTTQQLSFDFNTNTEILKELIQKHPNNALLMLFASIGIDSLISQIGSYTLLKEWIMEIMRELKSERTMYRQIKLLNELVIINERTKEKNQHNVINQTTELKELFYQKIN